MCAGCAVGNMNQAGNTPVNNIGTGYGGANPNMNTCQTGPNNVHLMAGQMQHMSARMGGNGQQTMTQQQHSNISMQSQNNQVMIKFISFMINSKKFLFIILFN